MLARECSGAVPAVAGATLRVCQPWLVVCRVGVALLRSAPVQGVSRPPHTASRDCRSGSPLARAIPCAPAPECGDTRKKEKSGWQNDSAKKRKATRIFVSDPTRSAASRAGMAGWAGEGGGRFGERREYEAPTLPGTPRQHGTARHHKRQAINNTPYQQGTARHDTRQPRNSTPQQQPSKKPQHRQNGKHFTLTNCTSRHHNLGVLREAARVLKKIQHPRNLQNSKSLSACAG